MAKSGKEKDGKSALEAAFRAYEAGDVVTARATAKRVLAEPTADDEKAAPRLAGLLELSNGTLGAAATTTVKAPGELPEKDAKAVASSIIWRTRVPGRPYLWAIGGATAYLLLVTLALVRYG